VGSKVHAESLFHQADELDACFLQRGSGRDADKRCLLTILSMVQVRI